MLINCKFKWWDTFKFHAYKSKVLCLANAIKSMHVNISKKSGIIKGTYTSFNVFLKQFFKQARAQVFFLEGMKIFYGYD